MDNTYQSVLKFYVNTIHVIYRSSFCYGIFPPHLLYSIVIECTVHLIHLNWLPMISLQFSKINLFPYMYWQTKVCLELHKNYSNIQIILAKYIQTTLVGVPLSNTLHWVDQPLGIDRLTCHASFSHKHSPFTWNINSRWPNIKNLHIKAWMRGVMSLTLTRLPADDGWRSHPLPRPSIVGICSEKARL